MLGLRVSRSTHAGNTQGSKHASQLESVPQFQFQFLFVCSVPIQELGRAYLNLHAQAWT